LSAGRRQSRVTGGLDPLGRRWQYIEK